MRLNKILLKRAVAAFAAACTLGTCCVAGSVAWASGETTTATEADTANIDTAKANLTSITIHKYEGPAIKTTGQNPQDIRSNGTDQSSLFTGDNARRPVKGVVFTVWRLKTYQTGPAATGGNTKTDEVIDLSKADGWSKIKDLKNLEAKTDISTLVKPDSGTVPNTVKFVKDTKYTCTTNGSGSCTVGTTSGATTTTTLPMGLYYIEETDISKAQIDFGTSTNHDWKKVSITTKVAPFFITTPLPNSDTATQKQKPWLYDVNVYPKNDTNTEVPTKTGSVNRQDLVGDTTVTEGQSQKTIEGTRITWTVSIPLTAPKDSTKYEKVGFVDRLNEKLTYEKIASANIITYKEQVKTDGTKEWVEDKPVSGQGGTAEVPLKETTDYTLTKPVKTGQTGANTNTLTFKLAEGTAAAGTAKATGRKAAFDAYTKANASTNPKKLAKLVVEIVTKVDDLTLNEIANVANTFVDENKTGKGDDENNPCTPGSTDPDCDDNTPNEIMHYGTLTVNKFFKGGPADNQKEMPLNGAKFDLYEVTGKPSITGGAETKVTSTDLPGTTTFAAGVTTTKNGSTITTKSDQGAGVSYNVKKITHKEPNSATDTTTTDKATTMETKEKTVQSGATSTKVEGTDSVRLLVYKAPKGNPKSVDTTRLYCVVETEPPAGYKLDSAPHCVWLKDDVQNDATTNNLVKVENVKATELDKILGNLPMTGARGLVILTLCGIVGIAGTFFYIVLKRRKEQEQE